MSPHNPLYEQLFRFVGKLSNAMLAVFLSRIVKIRPPNTLSNGLNYSKQSNPDKKIHEILFNVIN